MRIDPDILNELLKNRSESRKTSIISLLKSQSDDEAFGELKQIIRRYQFAKDRQVFNFSHLGLEVKDVANEVCSLFKDKTYNDVYSVIYGASKRGFKPNNKPTELIKAICDNYDCKEDNFVENYSEC